MTTTPFAEAHWLRDPFTYKGFSAYWDDDHPEREFWFRAELVESKYSNLIDNEVLRKWDSIDEENLSLSELTQEEELSLEWKRNHYFVDLEILCYETEAGDIEIASFEDVLIWAGIDPKDVVDKPQH